MPGIHEVRQLPYSAEQMFDLVADVGRYGEFLPWVKATRVRSNTESELVADMLVGFSAIRTKVTFDDPSRQLAISEEDFLSVSEAPYYADGVKSLAGDKDNSNIQVVSDTEARWERNPPLGKQWNFDIKIDVGGASYSCNGGSFTSAAVADKLVAICKSMKKK